MNAEGQHGFRADQARSYWTMEGRARALRKTLGLDPIERLPGLPLLARLRQLHYVVNGQTCSVDYAVNDLPQEALTKYDPKRKQFVVALTTSTYEGLDVDDPTYENPRDRFSLYHEVGHLDLHRGELVRLSYIAHETAALMRGPRPTHKPYFDTEWQANALAAALLMPADGLQAMERKGRLTATAVAQAFIVSQKSATFRLEVYTQRRAQLVSRTI